MFVFIPRKPKTTLRLPSDARYSAAFSDSSSVMPKPRLISTGNSCCRPTSFSSSKFCVLRVPICSMTPVGLPVALSAARISSTCDSWVTSIAMTRMPYLPASSNTYGRHVGAESLERVGIGPRLVGAHARADLAVLAAGASSSRRPTRASRRRKDRRTRSACPVRTDAVVFERGGRGRRPACGGRARDRPPTRGRLFGTQGSTCICSTVSAPVLPIR